MNQIETLPLTARFNRLRNLSLALLLLVTGSLYLLREYDSHQATLLILGAALGLSLFHASFGFTSAWRNLIVNRRGRGLRAQMLMLAVAVCLFFPVLSSGTLLGNDVAGYTRPLGWSVIFGAFIFGIGMQLGNGCASGNLYHVGGGQIRAIPSMIGFMIGGLWASADYEWWTSLPQFAPVAIIESLGTGLAIAINLALFAIIAGLSFWLEKRHHGTIEHDLRQQSFNLKTLLQGPWPFIWGGVGLALLNFAVLSETGRPWSVAVAYPLWGAKAYLWLEETFAIGLELELDFWAYWLQPGREEALMEPLLSDTVSVMNIGIILGAFLAATLAGKFSWQWQIPGIQWFAAILGGVMLGYGATISFGCNIGAYFGGIVSGSLHGWLWLIAAFAGSLLGTRLRPLFNLPN